MFGLDEAQLQQFIETISATAIANQATLKCLLRGLPVTVDNVILFVGDFFDPAKPEFASMIGRIQEAIIEVVANASTGRKTLDG